MHLIKNVIYSSFLEQGTQNRATGATDMNEKSSRSHAIILRSPSPSVLANKSNGLRRPESSAGFRTSDMSGEEGEWVITHSKFHFVDLAGSERVCTQLCLYCTDGDHSCLIVSYNCIAQTNSCRRR
jgi:hypothetical protein